MVMKDLFRQCMWPSEYPFCSGHHNNEDMINISHYNSNTLPWPYKKNFFLILQNNYSDSISEILVNDLSKTFGEYVR